jgi:hypothetical protein
MSRYFGLFRQTGDDLRQLSVYLFGFANKVGIPEGGFIMALTFFIVSKLKADLVITASNGAETLLDVSTKRTFPGWNNQLWELVGTELAGWYWLRNPTPGTNLVIDVQEKSGPPNAGSPLDGYFMKPGAEADDQVWAIYPVSGGYYYIQSFIRQGLNLVIDIQKGGAGPGLDIYEYQGKDWQLWTFVDVHGDSVQPPPPPPPT